MTFACQRFEGVLNPLVFLSSTRELGLLSIHAVADSFSFAAKNEGQYRSPCIESRFQFYIRSSYRFSPFSVIREGKNATIVGRDPAAQA